MKRDYDDFSNHHDPSTPQYRALRDHIYSNCDYEMKDYLNRMLLGGMEEDHSYVSEYWWKKKNFAIRWRPSEGLSFYVEVSDGWITPVELFYTDVESWFSHEYAHHIQNG